MNDVIWQPQPRQQFAMSRPEEEMLYGGSAGGGKTDFSVMELLRQVDIPNYRGLILRKTYPQLKDIIDRMYSIYPKAVYGCSYKDSKHQWTFPSGAKIYLGSLNDANAKYNYQGLAFDLIIFDELTQFTREDYEYLQSRNRPTGSNTRVYMRATANPGGVGHGWVKNRFIDVAPPNTTIREKVVIHTPNNEKIVKYRDRIFVPSTLFDNKILMQNDPNYMVRLAQMGEKERKALLYGDWDSFQGQVFTEWRNNEDGYSTRIGTHVITPFTIPRHWKIYRGMDWGYTKPYALGWFAVDEQGRMYMIREEYGSTGVANVGRQETPSQVAKRILEIENTDPNLQYRSDIQGIADTAIFYSDRGTDGSVAYLMEREGVYFDKARKDRLSGLMQFHNRLAFDDNGIPMFYVFNTCKNFIRNIPNLVYDNNKVEDVDTSAEDHDYDMARYVMMANPITPRVNSSVIHQFTNSPLSTPPSFNPYRYI